MLQRIQTIYLLLTAIGVFMLYFFPFGYITIVDDTFQYTVNGLEATINGETKILNSIPFNVLVPVIGTFSLLSLFLYKKRKVQLQLGRLSYLLHLTLIVLMFFALDGAAEELPNGDVAHIGYTGIYFPIASLAFIFLANRSIKKDEELVQSLNRIR